MFVAREKELALIRGLLSKKSGSIMVYGKRKVGKTTLINAAKLGFIYASGFESIPDEFICIPGDDIYSV